MHHNHKSFLKSPITHVQRILHFLHLIKIHEFTLFIGILLPCIWMYKIPTHIIHSYTMNNLHVNNTWFVLFFFDYRIMVLDLSLNIFYMLIPDMLHWWLKIEMCSLCVRFRMLLKFHSIYFFNVFSYYKLCYDKAEQFWGRSRLWNRDRLFYSKYTPIRINFSSKTKTLV